MDEAKKARWGSHVPINKTLLELFEVTGVMELGMGFFSTPMFVDSSPYTISIESDINWIANLKAEGITNTTKHKIVHHNVGDENIIRSTPYTDIPNDIKNKATEVYNQYLTDDINYLFIDCYGGLRLSALENLYNKVDIVVFHDAGKRDSVMYGYKEFTDHPGYIMYHDCSYSPWTGFLIKESLINDKKVKQIKNLHRKYLTEHTKKVPSYNRPMIKKDD